MSGSTGALIVAATPQELQGLLTEVDGLSQETVAGRPLYLGQLGALGIAAVVSGIGKANAAMATATALQAVPAPWVLAVGVGGGYPGSGLEVGDLAVATVEIYGDEGVDTPAGWQGLEAIGFPVWRGQGREYFGRLPTDTDGSSSLAGAAAREGHVVAGPFVTVSTVTGSAARAATLEERFASVCESMEGAAIAHAALVAGTRFVEVRGISNRVGPRQRADWQVGRAAQGACRAAVRWLRELPGVTA